MKPFPKYIEKVIQWFETDIINKHTNMYVDIML